VKTYRVVFEVIVSDAENEEDADDQARQLIRNVNFEPVTVEEYDRWS